MKKWSKLQNKEYEVRMSILHFWVYHKFNILSDIECTMIGESSYDHELYAIFFQETSSRHFHILLGVGKYMQKVIRDNSQLTVRWLSNKIMCYKSS